MAAPPFQPRLPNLSSLNVHTAERKPRSALSASERAEDGLYCLDKRNDINPCRSYIILKRAAIQATPEEFAEAEAFFRTNSIYVDNLARVSPSHPMWSKYA